MKEGIAVFTMMLGIAWCAIGCGDGSSKAWDGGTQLVSGEGRGATVSSYWFVGREFWLALAEEPGRHLTGARGEFLEGRTRRAAEELEKVAAILMFETRHCHSVKERNLLLHSVSELREIAGVFRNEAYPQGVASIEELDRVSAVAFRTIAAHQVTLGRDALMSGDARMAGRYILESTKALAEGFDLGGIPLDIATAAGLKGAKKVGARLEVEGDGNKEEGSVTLDALEAAVASLENVLTSRRN